MILIVLDRIKFKLFVVLLCHMRSSFSLSLLYHAYVYLEFLILACTIYILALAILILIHNQQFRIDAMLKQPNCPFVLFVGTRKLVKRREFEEYIRHKLVI